jgi:uncharacterized surface protein with fasciclin (FAS1) repeats
LTPNLRILVKEMVLKLRTTAIAIAAPLAVAAPVVAGASALASPASGNIVQVAASNKDFSTLVTAIKAAGLVKTLEGRGPFTVFAPTNAAFAAVPKATLHKLLEPKNKAALVKVLTYHVVAGKVTAVKVVKLHAAKTVEGQKIAIKVAMGTVYLNGSTKVIKTDIMASNGVIHVINKVLIPKGLTLK